MTLDKETGIGYYDLRNVSEKICSVCRFGYINPKVAPGEFNSIMPWTMYSGMEVDDLKAIFANLKTVKPIPNLVVKFTPAGSSE